MGERIGMSFGGQQDAVRYAGFWPRLLAQILDLLWLLPLSALLSVIGALVNGGEISDLGELMLNLIGALIVLLFWAERQGTPGKLVLGLKIVDAETGGTPTIGRLVLRYVGYLVSALPLGLGYLWIIWDARRQGWHDKMAGTVVIRDPRR
ncbi:RDD family protein [Falsiroseomonas sp. HW251]|uniref:RDD family protein n=1 Tax=Falsiroseomonas sp. HW251 TaxID=3390998 RepID=UPI003D310972